MDIERFLSHFNGMKKSGEGWQALCPAHEDRNRSLSISQSGDDRILIKCHAGCETADIVKAVGLKMSDLFTNRGKGSSPLKSTAHLHTTKVSNGKNNKDQCAAKCAVCSLVQYAAAKRLPVDFLQGLGLSDLKRNGKVSVRIPYFDESGRERAVQYRMGLNGGTGDRFKWRKGSKTLLYGLWKSDQGKDSVTLVEGASDCQTLWFHGYNTLGLPGAANYNEERDAKYFEPFNKIFIIHEPDAGGEAVYGWLSRSSIKEKAFVVELGEFKDPSALHIADPEQFVTRFNEALEKAVPFTKIKAEREARETAEALAQCKQIAERPQILDLFADLLPSCNLAGESRAARVLYLALVTRLTEKPVSVVVAGPSAAGKSHLVETVLKFFPDQAFHDLTAMSEKNLAYTEEPLEHRFLILYEAAGLSGDFATYLIRSLLSEGKIRYEFVEKTSEGLRSRLIEKEGPTGLIMTTTAVWLHPENETRLLTLTVSDTRDQTANVMLSLALEQEGGAVDFESWKALQLWLGNNDCHLVVVPFAADLARLTKPIAVRLRRDFGAFLSLIRAHALLHQVTRDRDPQGRIIANLDDYSAVLDLVGDIIAQGVEATVPESVKETVGVVAELIKTSANSPAYTTVAEAKERLNLDRSATSRRIQTAVRRGFVKLLEPKDKGQKKYVLGEPLPTEAGGIFPTREELAEVCRCANEEKTTAHLEGEQYQSVNKGVCRCAGGVGKVSNIPPFHEQLDLIEGAL